MECMLDIETLGTKGNSVITQIGAVYFDRATGDIKDKFSVNVSIQDCLDCGLNVDAGAIKFWLSQPPPYTFLTQALPLREALGKFRVFYKKNTLLWSHATFDIPILTNAHEAVGQKVPFNYKDLRDIRTLVDLSGVTQEEIKDGMRNVPTTHDALEDCERQVAYCYPLINRISGGLK